MTERHFRQCRLVRDGSETICWLDALAAQVGNMVQLKTADNLFWHVAEVYPFALTEEALRLKQERDRGSLSSLVKS